MKIPPKVLMSGYIERANGNVGVHDELYTRCLTLYDGKTKIVIISNDLLEVDKEITLNVRRALKEKFAVPFENIMICSTHTHSGPTITAWDLSVRDYLKKDETKVLKKEITQTIIDNALSCVSDLKTVNIGFAKSECSGVAGNRVEKNSISDYSVNTIQVTDINNDVVAVIVNYACHPTVLSANNLLISGDFPGVITKRLEERFINSTALFINGACGNQSTRFTRWGQDFEEAERMGVLLFDSVINALPKMQYANDFVELNAMLENITFPKKNFPPREELVRNLAYSENVKNNAISNNLSAGEKRVAVTKYQGALISLNIFESLDKSGDINSEIQIFRIGDIEIVGIPVELFVEYGIEIISNSLSPNTIIAGYANEVLGYVYTKDAAEKGGYEAYASPFSAEAGEFIVKKVLEMEKTLF
jgi:hypothetical protein